MLDVFCLDCSPRIIGCQSEGDVLTEVEALKNRVEELEQLVSRLTLEDDLLKRGKEK